MKKMEPYIKFKKYGILLSLSFLFSLLEVVEEQYLIWSYTSNGSGSVKYW